MVVSKPRASCQRRPSLSWSFDVSFASLKAVTSPVVAQPLARSARRKSPNNLFIAGYSLENWSSTQERRCPRGLSQVRRAVLLDARIPSEHGVDHLGSVVRIAQIGAALAVLAVHPKQIAGAKIDHADTDEGMPQLWRRTSEDVDNRHVASDGARLAPGGGDIVATVDHDGGIGARLLSHRPQAGTDSVVETLRFVLPRIPRGSVHHELVQREMLVEVGGRSAGKLWRRDLFDSRLLGNRGRHRLEDAPAGLLAPVRHFLLDAAGGDLHHVDVDRQYHHLLR